MFIESLKIWDSEYDVLRRETQDWSSAARDPPSLHWSLGAVRACNGVFTPCQSFGTIFIVAIGEQQMSVSEHLGNDPSTSSSALTGSWLAPAANMAFPRGRRTGERAAALLTLGRCLSAVRTEKEAAQIIATAAETLCGWDAFALDLYSPGGVFVNTVFCVDTIDGCKSEVATDSNLVSPVAQRVIKQAVQILLNRGDDGFPEKTIPFGDKSRPSQSLMYVPVRNDAKVIGVLSVQSYTLHAYTQEDLSNVQALADHCGGALERLRAEAALRDANERLRLALAAGKMGTWTTELTGTRQAAISPELEGILGLRAGEFAGTEEALFGYIHPHDRNSVRQALTRAIESKRDCEVEFRFLSRDRPAGWLLGRGRVYYDAEGKPVRVAGVAIDITTRKEAEQEISRFNSELEQRVSQRTAQLHAINRELESFAYSVSHDLRAPLRSIRGFCQVLLERYAAQLDAIGLEYLHRACNSSVHMDRLIDDLLKLSHAGRSELHWRSVNLTALAESIAAELRKAEPERHVEFVIEANLRAHGDERLLRVALENLFRNAWKFTGPQPVARIEFGFAPEPEPAFRVRDNGVGFDPAYAGKLFGVFQRLHSTSEFPGTGIGLATVQRIILRHGGRVWATGVVNAGATFYFSLPVNEPLTCESVAAGVAR
jgi:PAS domain S-box-containing protein